MARSNRPPIITWLDRIVHSVVRKLLLRKIKREQLEELLIILINQQQKNLLENQLKNMEKNMIIQK